MMFVALRVSIDLKTVGIRVALRSSNFGNGPTNCRCFSNSSCRYGDNPEYKALKRFVKDKQDLYWKRRERASIYGGVPGANKALKSLGFQDEADPGLAKMNLDYDPTRTDSREYGLLTMMENTKELERKLDDQQRAGGSFWQEEQ